MKTPQIIIICIFVASIVLHAAKNGQQKRSPNYDVGEAIINILVWVLLLWWGGFWDN